MVQLYIPKVIKVDGPQIVQEIKDGCYNKGEHFEELPMHCVESDKNAKKPTVHQNDEQQSEQGRNDGGECMEGPVVSPEIEMSVTNISLFVTVVFRRPRVGSQVCIFSSPSAVGHCRIT